MQYLTKGFMWLADFIYQRIPYSKSIDQDFKIVAHRGWHNHQNKIENTLMAFDSAHKAGAWGIEFDVRWTKDLVPVVHHDPSCKRVWGRDIVIGDITFEDLRVEIPEIPSLEEVIERFGKKTHLFIELKWEKYPKPIEQNSILLFLLKNLEPGKDFHFLSVEPRVFDFFTTLPKQYKLLVGTSNIYKISDIALEQEFGGVLGHYLLLNQKRVAEHLRAGQLVGTGYLRSKNLLNRERRRGVEFYFTNHPWSLLDSVDET